ncbi:hypothetical protein YC2023_048261 [Brassica napus]
MHNFPRESNDFYREEKEGGGQREEGTTWAGEENRGLHEDPRVLPLWDVLPHGISWWPLTETFGDGKTLPEQLQIATMKEKSSYHPKRESIALQTRFGE